MRRVVTAIAALAALAVAGCTSSGTSAPSSLPGSTNYTTVTQTKPVPTPTISTPKPVTVGPTKAATASACPLLATQTAVDTGGMRLGRVTVLTASGKLVGCRFYGQQSPNDQCNATCLAKEKLPPGKQPAIEITTVRYRSDLDAHNAIALIARSGTQPQQVDIGTNNIGVCYQTTFYVKDAGKDWACTFSIAKLAVVVKTVASLSSIARAVSVAVARKV